MAARPGTYVDPTRPIAFIAGDADDETRDAVRKAFIVGGDRVLDADPSFGLVILSEIALRALSPALNDPGTAIDVINTQTRLLDEWGAQVVGAEDVGAEEDVRFAGLSVAEIDPSVLVTDAFAAIARDGAAMIEVQLQLQKSLATLAATRPGPFGEPARRMSREALERARAAMRYQGDVETLEAAAAAVGQERVAEPATTDIGKQAASSF